MVSQYLLKYDSVIQELTREEGKQVLRKSSTFSAGKNSTREKVKRESCVVCGDKATGSHYRAVTCEGCKGFFRRTIQKKMDYTCDFEGDCVIDKLTRTQCQKCRLEKCIAVGMVSNIVLSEKQRAVIRQQRDDKRLIRQLSQPKKEPDDKVVQQPVSQLLKALISGDPVELILQAYRSSFPRLNFSQNTSKPLHVNESGSLMSVYVAEMLTSTVSKVIQFSKSLPGFTSLDVSDQMVLLQSSCLEVLCLRSGLRYDAKRQGFPLRIPGHFLTRTDLLVHSELAILSPLFSYATRVQELCLKEVEVALLAASWILQSSRPELKEPERVSAFQDAILSMAGRLHGGSAGSEEQQLRWLQALITRPPPLKGFSVARQPEKCAIYVSINDVLELPISFVHLLEENS